MKSPAIRQRPLACTPLPDLHPVVARVLAARGIDDPAALDPSLKHLLAPDLADIERAADRIAEAMQAGERILIVGDFDADGATSVALAMRVLRAFGHAAVDYLVPNRFDYGYGLSPELVDRIADNPPALIITVDNGIASHEGIARANALGIDVIVTDHHLPGPVLPPAHAIVNPNREDCAFAGIHLAGVGVTFYLLAAVRTRLKAMDWFSHRGEGRAPAMAEFLDLVALGTVADVVRLDRNNRILVEQGLRRIRAGHGCPGIVALLQAARREPADATAGDLGYVVAPRLNAAGRLADMALGIETLLATDRPSAREAARKLDTLNRERREIESEMKTQADQELERLRADLDASETLPMGLVLHDSRWHQGVIGILAGRVREMLHRPVVIFADDGNGALKGSARSIPDLHVRDVLATVDARNPGLIERFGGHAMAAGLTLACERMDAFRAAFSEAVARALDGSLPEPVMLTDGPLAGSELGLDTAEALRTAGPWGAGFPEPCFDGEFRVLDHRTVGERHLKLSVQTSDGVATREAIMFNVGETLRRDPGSRVRLIYRLEVNQFRGRRTPQLVILQLDRLA